MNYPEEMCKPMREDLTSVGFIEMRTSEESAAGSWIQDSGIPNLGSWYLGSWISVFR